MWPQVDVTLKLANSPRKFALYSDMGQAPFAPF
jgi:hypothetical protein